MRWRAVLVLGAVVIAVAIAVLFLWRFVGDHVLALREWQAIQYLQDEIRPAMVSALAPALNCSWRAGYPTDPANRLEVQNAGDVSYAAFLNDLACVIRTDLPSTLAEAHLTDWVYTPVGDPPNFTLTLRAVGLFGRKGDLLCLDSTHFKAGRLASGVSGAAKPGVSCW